MGFLKQKPTEGAAWARACTLGTFTHAQLAKEIGVDIGEVGAIVRGWEAHGWVERTDSRVAHAGFRVIAGPQPVKITEGSREAHMWNAIRQFPSFSATDVAATSDIVTVEDARAYIGVLFRHDYLRCTRKADPSKGREASYKLIRNTGPRAPVLKRIRAVIDPNTGEHHIREGKL